MTTVNITTEEKEVIYRLITSVLSGKLMIVNTPRGGSGPTMDNPAEIAYNKRILQDLERKFA